MKQPSHAEPQCIFVFSDSVPGHCRHDGGSPRGPLLCLHRDLPDGDQCSSHLVPGNLHLPGHFVPSRGSSQPLAALHGDWPRVRRMHLRLYQHHLPDDSGEKRGHPAAAPQRLLGDPEENAAPHPSLLGG